LAKAKQVLFECDVNFRRPKIYEFFQKHDKTLSIVPDPFFKSLCKFTTVKHTRQLGIRTSISFKGVEKEKRTKTEAASHNAIELA
jgi:hypothetical protein